MTDPTVSSSEFTSPDGQRQFQQGRIPPPRHDRKFFISLALHKAVLSHFELDPRRVIERGFHGVEVIRPHVRGGATELVNHWARLFADGDVEGIRRVLVGENEHAVEMRHVTPFLDVLTPAERQDVLDRVYATRDWEA